MGQGSLVGVKSKVKLMGQLTASHLSVVLVSGLPPESPVPLGTGITGLVQLPGESKNFLSFDLTLVPDKKFYLLESTSYRQYLPWAAGVYTGWTACGKSSGDEIGPGSPVVIRGVRLLSSRYGRV